jgi:hypothetical protein
MLIIAMWKTICVATALNQVLSMLTACKGGMLSVAARGGAQRTLTLSSSSGLTGMFRSESGALEVGLIIHLLLVSIPLVSKSLTEYGQRSGDFHFSNKSRRNK